jgi:hypothetical protein
MIRIGDICTRTPLNVVQQWCQHLLNIWATDTVQKIGSLKQTRIAWRMFRKIGSTQQKTTLKNMQMCYFVLSAVKKLKN